MTVHSLTCKNCNANVAGELLHLGFSDMDCMYCDSCPRVLLVKDHSLAEKHGIKWPHFQPGDAGWEYYNRHLLPYYARFEALFKPCVCGGHFKASASPRCPKCNDFLAGTAPPTDQPSTWQHKRHVFITLGSVADTEWLRDAQSGIQRDGLASGWSAL
jgi:hypothetical protein